MPNELQVLKGWQKLHWPPPHTLPLMSSAMQRLKSSFWQVGLGVGATTGLRVGLLVGLGVGRFVVGASDG